MNNPIKKKLDELGISTHAAARILSTPPDDTISQPSVYYHYTDKRRISMDSMEKYASRLQVKMKDMRDWNKYLKEQMKINKNNE